MMNEVVHTDEDVRRQELRLEQINAKINRCRKELKNKSKLLKQQHNMLKLSPINSQIDNNDN